MDSTNKKVEEVFQIYQKNRIKNNVDEKLTNTKAKRLKKEIKIFVEKNNPINFVLPAFPCKSPNTEKKVLGQLPDKAEEVALENLHNFCKSITNIHPPGCKITIASDGRCAVPAVKTTDKIVTKYNEKIRNIFPSIFLCWWSLDSFFPAHDHSKKREKLISNFGQTISKVEEEINNDKDTNKLYRGFIKFLMEDNKWNQDLSNNQKRKECKQRAKKLLQATTAYSNLINFVFEDYIRLSIHPHPYNMEKFGINLIDSKDKWGTPWHNVLVKKKNGKNKIMHKEDAEQKEYQLISERGRPSYYKEK